MSGWRSGHRTASVSACLVSTMSPTSSRVRLPTATSGEAERETGRITSSAPIRSDAMSLGGSPSLALRAAALNAASRVRAARSAATKPGVREAISPRSIVSVGTLSSNAASRPRRILLSGSPIESSRSQRSGSRRRAIEVLRGGAGADQCHPGCGDRYPQGVEDQRRDGIGLGGQECFDVADQQYGAVLGRTRDQLRCRGFDGTEATRCLAPHRRPDRRGR